MTIQRTRELLKEKVARLSDDEVLQLIQRAGETVDVLFTLSTKLAIANRKGKAYNENRS